MVNFLGKSRVKDFTTYSDLFIFLKYFLLYKMLNILNLLLFLFVAWSIKLILTNYESIGLRRQRQ